MEIHEMILLVVAGLAAGFINTVAGGGSLITLPLLIFMGLPAADANASNRIALFVQNIFAVRGFKSKGISVFPFSYWLAISATLGAVLGAYIAVDIDDQLFNKILAVVMIMVLILTITKPLGSSTGKLEEFGLKKTVISVILFFFIGIYGGFIQAGVGFLVIAALVGVHRLNMAKTNSIKVFVILCYTVFAIIVFLIEEKVRWSYGLTLAFGNASGAWIGSRWSADKDDRIIRLILIVAVSALSIKLWFF